MEENEAGVEEIPASVRVLLNAELLDMIFSFVETPVMLNLRSVCKKWRSVTNLSLKRRLNISTSTTQNYFSGRNRPTSYEITFNHLEKVKYSPKVPEDISSSALTISPQSKDPDERGKFFREYVCLPTSPIVSILLEQPWIPKVTKLILKECLTLNEWNALGCHIVRKLTSLTNLSVCLHHSKSKVLPMCYHEITSQPVEHRIKFEKLTELAVYCGKKGLENATNICYDVLNRCPNLKNFRSDISWKPSAGSLNKQGYTVSALRGKPAESHTSDKWKCSIRSKTRRTKTTLAFNNVFVQDAINLLKCMQPFRQLQLSLNLDLLATVPPICVDNIDTLTLYHDSLDEAPIEAVIPALRAMSSICRNVKKMSLKINPSNDGGQLNLTNSVPRGTNFENLTILQLDRDSRCRSIRTPIRKSWQLQKIYTMAPNVELLSMSFFKGELLKILKLANKFSKLKHLVLFRRSSDSMILDDDDGDELYHLQAKCLSPSLVSLTVIICGPCLLKKYTKAFVKACTGINSMRQLKIYSGNEPEDEFRADQASAVDLSTLGLNIPSNLEVLTGHPYMLQGKATFISMEDPDLTWNQLRGDQHF